MLLQSLVQNRIISTDHSNEFQLDWSAAAPILNLNFFHTIKLIEESGKYRKLLRPWEEVEMPLEGEWVFNSSLPFYLGIFNISFTSNGKQCDYLSFQPPTIFPPDFTYANIQYRPVAESPISVYSNGTWVAEEWSSILITDASSLTTAQRQALFNYLIKNATLRSQSPQLKLHQYYTSTVANSDYNIYPGSWVGRVSTLYPNDTLKDCLVLASPCQYYIYDYVANNWVLNGTQGVPCILRPPMTGLKDKQLISLSNSSVKLLEKRWQVSIDNTNYIFAAPSSWTNSDAIPIQLEQDLILGRVILNGETLANVPVTILRKWNSQKICYEYALTFPDFNFPSNAQVEFY